MNVQKMARIGLAMIGAFFLSIALACVGYVMLYGLDVGKMYKEYRAKERLEELRKSAPGMTLIEYCRQHGLECALSAESGTGFTATSAQAFFSFWKSVSAGSSIRFGWESSERIFNTERDGYRSSQSFWTAGPKFKWESGSQNFALPSKEPPMVPLDEVPAPPAK